MGWDDRDWAVAQLDNFYYQRAENYRSQYHTLMMGDWKNKSASDPAAFSTGLFNTLNALDWCLIYLIGKVSNQDFDFAVPIFLSLHTIAEAPATDPFTLSWKDIVKAYSEASDAGKMWLITEADWMRKQMWTKPTVVKWNENPFE